MKSINNFILFYNKQIKTNETVEALTSRGLPEDLEFLKSINIYPIKLNKPEYDKSTQVLIPSTFEFDERENIYVQNFIIEDLAAELQLNELEYTANLKRKEVQLSADSAAKTFLEQFSSIEKLTWFKQQQEVAEYIKDPQHASTPTMDEIANIRGIDRVVLINKAIEKLNQFNTHGLKIIGQQQKYEDQIKSIQNNEELSISDRIKQLKSLSFSFNESLITIENNTNINQAV